MTRHTKFLTKQHKMKNKYKNDKKRTEQLGMIKKEQNSK